MYRVLLALVFLLTPLPVGGETPPPPLVLEAVLVTPETPAADTLCQLRVRVKNGSDKAVTGLAFTVTVGGHELAVYRRQVYLQAFSPGATTELRLYNFWTSETGRPAPADGVLPVKVTLREAQYVAIAKAENGDETWELGEKVAGLPISAERVLRLKK